MCASPRRPSDFIGVCGERRLIRPASDRWHLYHVGEDAISTHVRRNHAAYLAKRAEDTSRLGRIVETDVGTFVTARETRYVDDVADIPFEVAVANFAGDQEGRSEIDPVDPLSLPLVSGASGRLGSVYTAARLTVISMGIGE